MINTDMRNYDYYTYSTYDDYGQPIISDQPKGKVKMAINIVSQNVQDHI